MGQPLHYICFDQPYPPTYGGVIDSWFRIQALANAGVALHMHCFSSERGPSPELEAISQSVHYYERMKPLKSLPVRRPYITASRRSKLLLQALKDKPYPIFFEGLHSCRYLDHPDLKDRIKLVRMHNIEWQYYQQLAAQETELGKKLYLNWESRVLKRYEPILWAADRILTISPADQTYFEEKYVTATYLPAFHPHTHISSLEGKGEYCLYHAKLSVAENHQAAMFLIDQVFRELHIPLIIAGSEPKPELIYAISQHEHVSLRHDPGTGEMLDLMRNAHIHVLPTFQDTGIKLKLINALFCGRFLIVNAQMVAGSGLERACMVAQDARDFRDLIRQLFALPFTQQEVDFRQKLLTGFSNQQNAMKVMAMLNP